MSSAPKLFGSSATTRNTQLQRSAATVIRSSEQHSAQQSGCRSSVLYPSTVPYFGTPSLYPFTVPQNRTTVVYPSAVPQHCTLALSSASHPGTVPQHYTPVPYPSPSIVGPVPYAIPGSTPGAETVVPAKDSLGPHRSHRTLLHHARPTRSTDMRYRAAHVIGDGEARLHRA